MKKILIVIDMQNDFIDGSLGTGEAVGIVEAVKEKIKEYPPENVIATMDTHGENYMETQEGQYLPVIHCIKGTEGWEIRPGIAELLKGARIYEKPTFGSTAMMEDLKALSEKEELELELIGLCTDICVVSNALLLKAAMPEVKISVDPACCAGVTPEKHEAALETMRSCQICVEPVQKTESGAGGALICRRIYDKSETSGYRFLVDRLWPRGIRKETAGLDQWEKGVAPSNELCKWYGRDPEKFEEFAKRYRQELDASKEAAEFAGLCREKLAAREDVYLLYASKDEEKNNAAVLKTWLEEKLG